MMRRVQVIKAFVQADPDPSRPHHRYGEGECDMPDWIATKAVDRGEAEVVPEPEPDPEGEAKAKALAEAEAAKKAGNGK